MRRWLQFKLRKFIKPPTSKARAVLLRRRLAFWYLFLAWNAFGLGTYFLLKQEYPMTSNEKKMPALWYLRLIGENEVNIVTIDGLTQKSNVHFNAITDQMSPSNNNTIFPVKRTDEEEELPTQ